jgi:DNA-binding MarR family transcriptional regulator
MGAQELLYNLIKETFFLLDDGDRRFFRKFDLTVSRYYALYHIGKQPGISFSQLSEHMVCDKSNVTRIIKGLEEANYVARLPHETDGRTLRLYLTEEGTAVRQKVTLAHKSYNENRLNCLNAIQHEGLVAGLARLNEYMRAELVSPLN